MALFNKILFPVDFSKRCQTVAPAVASLVRHHQAELVLFHSLELPAGAYADWYAFSAMVDVESIRENQRKLLDQFDPGPVGDRTVSRVMVDGPPVPSIVQYAREHGIGLIAIPTHGYGRFRSLLIGSIAAGVLHDTECPVWTAAHTEELPAAHAPYDRILCAVDLCRNSPRVLECAERLARDYEAELRVGHVIPQVYDPLQSFDAADFRHTLVEEARDRYARIAREAGAQAELEIFEGAVGMRIAETAKSWDADLVVAGRGHLTQTLGRLRTHTYDVIRHSPCAVLTV